MAAGSAQSQPELPPGGDTHSGVAAAATEGVEGAGAAAGGTLMAEWPLLRPDPVSVSERRPEDRRGEV